MKKLKYLIHPDHVVQGNKSTTFVTAEKLMELHNVDPEECAVAQYSEDRDTEYKRIERGSALGGLINLYVEEDYRLYAQ